MYLLYLDESGTVGDSDQKYFVLAGVAVFERATHWIEQDLQRIAARVFPTDPSAIELHGSPMRGGRGMWRHVTETERFEMLRDCLKVVQARHPRDLQLFGSVILKSATTDSDPIELAFEQLCHRFDVFLKRMHLRDADPQRGLILFDKSSTEQRIQTMARDFKYRGHRWGTTRNYAEVPVFLDSRASRLVQLADIIAFALFRHCEHEDEALFQLIRPYFFGGLAPGLCSTR